MLPNSRPFDCLRSGCLIKRVSTHSLIFLKNCIIQLKPTAFVLLLNLSSTSEMCNYLDEAKFVIYARARLNSYPALSGISEKTSMLSRSRLPVLWSFMVNFHTVINFPCECRTQQVSATNIYCLESL